MLRLGRRISLEPRFARKHPKHRVGGGMAGLLATLLRSAASPSFSSGLRIGTVVRHKTTRVRYRQDHHHLSGGSCGPVVCQQLTATTVRVCSLSAEYEVGTVPLEEVQVQESCESDPKVLEVNADEVLPAGVVPEETVAHPGKGCMLRMSLGDPTPWLSQIAPDVRPEVCEAHCQGLRPGARLVDQDGDLSTFVGLHDRRMWFHLDGRGPVGLFHGGRNGFSTRERSGSATARLVLLRNGSR